MYNFVYLAKLNEPLAKDEKNQVSSADSHSSSHIGEVSGGGGLGPPIPWSWTIFFQTESAHDTLLYTVIHSYLKILPLLSVRYARRLNPLNVPTSIACRLQSYLLRAYCHNTQSYLFYLLWTKEKKRIVFTRCHILKLKCIKFDFRWGWAPDIAGSLQRSPRLPRNDRNL